MHCLLKIILTGINECLPWVREEDKLTHEPRRNYLLTNRDGTEEYNGQWMPSRVFDCLKSILEIFRLTNNKQPESYSVTK